MRVRRPFSSKLEPLGPDGLVAAPACHACGSPSRCFGNLHDGDRPLAACVKGLCVVARPKFSPTKLGPKLILLLRGSTHHQLFCRACWQGRASKILLSCPPELKIKVLGGPFKTIVSQAKGAFTACPFTLGQAPQTRLQVRVDLHCTLTIDMEIFQNNVAFCLGRLGALINSEVWFTKTPNINAGSGA